MEKSWAFVPHVVLTTTFSMLDVTDRINASQVCTNWAKAFKDPFVWHHVKIQVDTDGTIFKDQLFKIISQFGKYIKHIQFIWGRSDQYTHDNSIHYVNVLITQNVQLISFAAVNWVHCYKWPNRNKFVLAVSKFLRSQSHLANIEIRNSSLRQSEVLYILASASPRKLRKVNLQGAFRKWLDPYSHPRFRNLIQGMCALTELHVDYNCISAHVLETLCVTAPNLKFMNISIKGVYMHHPHVSNYVWLEVAKKLPKLRVRFDIYNIACHEELTHFLHPGVPLSGLHLSSVELWDQNLNRSFQETLFFLMTFYDRSLEYVNLSFARNMEFVDSTLIEVISKCRNLKYFQYNGVIRDFSVLQKIFEYFQESQQKQFKYIGFYPKFVSKANRVYIANTLRCYEPFLVEQGIECQLTEPSSLFQYC